MNQTPYNAQTSVLTSSGGQSSKLNITAATAIKAVPGRLVKITVLTVATGGTFGAYDVATTGAAATANAIVQYGAAWPAAGSVISLDWPCANGIVVNPGTGGAVSVSYI
jgi:hypothetical protein